MSAAETVAASPETATGERSRAVLWVLLGSFAVHAALFPAAGWERDVNWFWLWTKNALEFGVAHLSEHVECDYAPAYLYVLKGMGLLWTFVTAGPLPADGTLALRALVKLLPSLANLATAWLVWQAALPRLGRRAALLALAAYAFNPAMLFATAFWGQIDSVVCLLVAGALLALARGRTGLAFSLLSAAVLTKFQQVVLLPPFLVAAYRLEGAGGIRKAFRASALTALVLLLPFFWAGRVDTVLATAFGAVGRYPSASMNAHNVWWLAVGPRAPWISDAMRVGNALLSYRSLGLLMFLPAMALVCWRLWRGLSRSGGDALTPLAEAGALATMAFYLFPTQMHERYLLPALVFLALAAIGRKATWWLYGTVSVAALVSLAGTLHTWWPDNLGPAGPLFPEGRQEATAAAVLFVASFLVLLLWNDDRRFAGAAIGLAVSVALVVTGIAKFPVTATTRLCDLDPVETSQGWGTLHRDRTVENRRLAVAGYIFRHGIGTHAVSKVRYHLNGAFRTFETEYGLDNEANRGQRARYRILVDDRVAHDSGDVTTGGPGHARFSVAGARFLTLEVLDGGDGVNYDHADWLEPVLRR